MISFRGVCKHSLPPDLCQPKTLLHKFQIHPPPTSFLLLRSELAQLGVPKSKLLLWWCLCVEIPRRRRSAASITARASPVQLARAQTRSPMPSSGEMHWTEAPGEPKTDQSSTNPHPNLSKCPINQHIRNTRIRTLHFLDVTSPQ